MIVMEDVEVPEENLLPHVSGLKVGPLSKHIFFKRHHKFHQFVAMDSVCPNNRFVKNTGLLYVWKKFRTNWVVNEASTELIEITDSNSEATAELQRLIEEVLGWNLQYRIQYFDL